MLAKRRLRELTTDTFGPEVGCHDGGCVFGHLGGMQTNGGCQCLKAPPVELRRNLLRLARLALALATAEAPRG